MEASVLLGLASILILGIAAQWLSWRLRLPSILLLLLTGFLAGPLSAMVRPSGIPLLDPDRLLGDLLFPIVSLSVGLILFEGGLSLRLSELREIAAPLRNLIVIGSTATLLISAAAAVFVLKLDVRLAFLLGGILVVTGPTVIVPLLRQVRPTGQVGSILKWEGILIDPVGATLALLIFESILISEAGGAAGAVALGLVKTVLIGGGFGLAGAAVLTQALRRYWIPDFLESSMTLMVVIGAFTASNLLQEESGLLTATVMGFCLANQRSADVRRIIEFKENLRVLLISGLFIVLAARLRIDQIQALPLSSFAFLGILVFVARPVSVALATARSKLSWKERAFLGWLAPRGIVAAAVSSIFSLRLADAGFPDAEILAPLTFMVIVGTVAIYGLTAVPVSRWLGVAAPNPQGVLIVGAHSWARTLASELQGEGIAVLLSDTNWANISSARMAGLPAYFGNVLSEHASDETDLGGIGRLIALTPNEEVNSLSATHYSGVFGRSEVYQLPPEKNLDTPREIVAEHLRGRLLFGPEMTYFELSRRFAQGGVIKKTRLTDEFDYQSYCELYAQSAIPLLLIDQNGNLRLFTVKDPPKPQSGHLIVSLVSPGKEEPPPAGSSQGTGKDSV